jgi:hypothetical protein
MISTGSFLAQRGAAIEIPRGTRSSVRPKDNPPWRGHARRRDAMSAPLPIPPAKRIVFLSGLLATASAVVLLILAQSPAGADPVDDSTLSPYRAGWYSNAAQPKTLTCADTCQTKAKAVAEYEASAVPPTKRAFVCRVAVTRDRWLYGSQFDDRPACYTVGLDLKGSYNDNYMCLCVAARGRGGE